MIKAIYRYWRDVHGAIAARIPELRRYVQCHAITRGADGSEYGGAAEAWFDRTTLIFTEEVPILA